MSKNLFKNKSRELLNSAKKRAIKKEYSFNIDREWVEERLSNVCELSGIKFDISIGNWILGIGN